MILVSAFGHTLKAFTQPPLVPELPALRFRLCAQCDLIPFYDASACQAQSNLCVQWACPTLCQLKTKLFENHLAQLRAVEEFEPVGAYSIAAIEAIQTDTFRVLPALTLYDTEDIGAALESDDVELPRW